MAFIISRIMRYRKLVLITFLAALFSAACDLYLPDLMAKIVDIGIVNGDMDYVIKTGFKMLFAALIASVLTIIMVYFSTKVAALVARDLGFEMFTHVEKFSLNEFNEVNVSSLITRFTNDISQLQMFIMMGIRILIGSSLTAVGGTVMAISKNGSMAVIILFAVLILAVLLFYFAKHTMRLSALLQQCTDKINAIIRETLNGMRVVRAFTNEDYEQERFAEANYRLTKTAIIIQRIFALLMPFLMLVLNYTTISILFMGSHAAAKNSIMTGEIMAVVQYIALILMALMMLSFVLTNYPRAAISAKRIKEVLNITPSIKDDKNAVDTLPQKGTLVFDNVSFKYPNSEGYALKNISFNIEKGQTVAIIGSTGSGKSTLLNLIMRFYDVSEGNILFDGVDIRHIKLDTLRSKIGYASQTPLLFSGTILENLRFGGENLTEEQVKEGAKTAQALNFIEQKEESLQFKLSQGATNLSGGQKQRLSIARTILKSPEMLLFDDSFSALDYNTDRNLRNALKTHTSGVTIIIVAQRIGTISSCDKIIVINEGTICGIGTHDKLLESCRVYREIALSQQSREVP